MSVVGDWRTRTRTNKVSLLSTYYDYLSEYTYGEEDGFAVSSTSVLVDTIADIQRIRTARKLV